MMELTTNSFTKGLQMDVHPMVAGKDSYTDCLNGTITTLHGNEVILQNDMGNRRVDNAFLPAGYQPVGIKEYGGIIYVASYNPITNKSLLGSFPSPLRKITSYDDESLKYSGSINFLTSTVEGWGDVQFLIKDTETITLTNDKSLHAGDKFVVYGIIEIDGERRGLADLTNYENIWYLDNNYTIHSPKNKRYTLSLGVFDSKHQFIDITSSLERWDVSGESYNMLKDINKECADPDKIELYKFNRGYFIAPQKPADLIESIEDAKLIEKRKLVPANTYSYKLVGPLGLLFKYNHISNVLDYNITGEKLGEGLYDLTVLATLQYNCPDGILVPYSDTSSHISSIYHTYEIGERVNSVFNGFDLYDLERSNNFCNNVEETYGIPEYDPDSNLYKVVVSKTYRGVTPSEGTLFNYIFAVGEKNKYFLGLSSKGTIDLNKIGSGIIEINNWRYIWNESNKNLTIGIEAYPKKGEKFANLKIDLAGSIILKDGTLGFLTGFNEDIQGLTPQKVYIARISYDILKDNGYTTHVYDDGFIYWILTTELFNEHYNNFNGTFIPNFAKLRDSNGSIKKINEIFPELTYSFELEWIKLKLIIGPDFTTRNKPVIYNKNSSIIGSALSKEELPIKVKGTLTINFGINTTVNLGLNTKLYPDYLIWESTFDSTQIHINLEQTKSNIEEIQRYYRNNITSNPKDLEIDINEFVSESLNIEDGVITGSITWNDIHVYNPALLSGEIKKAFDTADKYFKEIEQNESDFCSYFGFSLDCHDEIHYIALIKGPNNQNYFTLPYRHSDAIIVLNTEKPRKFRESAFGEDYWDFARIDFNSAFENLDSEDYNKNFAYLYVGLNVHPSDGNLLYYGNAVDSFPMRYTTYPQFNKSRLYWKDIDGNWALVGVLLLNNGQTFISQFKKLFVRDGENPDDYMNTLVFCMFNSTNDYTLYKADLANPIYYNNIIEENDNLWYKLDICLNLGDNVNFVSNLRPEGHILNFSASTSDYHTTVTINLILSNIDFWNYISMPLNMELIDIEHGLNVDSNGNLLKEDYIYIYKNGLLIRSDIPVGSRSDSNGKRQLVCKSSKTGEGVGFNTDYYYIEGHTERSTGLLYFRSGLVDSEYNIRSVGINSLKIT